MLNYVKIYYMSVILGGKNMSETNELREVEELKKEFFDFVEDTKSISETIRKNEDDEEKD